MCLFDTHCHLDLMVQKGIDIDTALQQASKAGVERILVPGIDASNWNVIQQYSHKYPMVDWAMGIHPMFVSEHSIEHIKQMKTRLERGEDCIAIGECGLDFYHGRDNQALQVSVLIEQLKLALHYHLPVLLHVRKAHQELIQVLKQYPLPRGGVLHGFTGSYEQGMQYIEQGLFLGIGGSITYERAKKTRNAVARLPLDKLLLETDAPDMPLNGYQGLPNQPKFIKNVLSSLILLRNESEQTITLKLSESVVSLFE